MGQVWRTRHVTMREVCKWHGGLVAVHCGPRVGDGGGIVQCNGGNPL